MKHFQKNRLFYAYTAAILLVILAMLSGILLGATRISLWDSIGSILSGDTGSPDARILLYVRLPRVLGGLLCGCALALSGAVLQGVLANKLASPSIIGVNAGAGLAVTVCTALGCYGATATAASSFAGAFIAVSVIAAGGIFEYARRNQMVK